MGFFGVIGNLRGREDPLTPAIPREPFFLFVLITYAR